MLLRASQRDAEALEEVVSLVQQGNERAQAAFWPWLANKLRPPVRSWTQADADGLDDYVWGAIEHLVGRLDRYERQPRGSFLGWALVVARHHVLRERRREQRGTLVPLDEHERAVEDALQRDAPPGPASVELVSLVGEVLEQLEPRQREAVLLYYVLGYTAKDVARIMGISERTVRSHLDQAKQKVRAANMDH